MKKLFVMTLMIGLIIALILSGCSTAPAPKPAPAPAPSPTSAPAPAPSPAPSPKPTTAPAPPGQIVWRMDSMWNTDREDFVYLKQACDEILEASEGRLKIEPYPSSSLKLAAKNMFSNLRDGLVESAQAFWQQAEGEEESFATLEAKGIWENQEQVWKAIDAMVPFKKKVLAEQWNSVFIAPALLTVNLNQAFTIKPVKTLADLKGMKIRVPSARVLELFKEFGAAPMLMPLPDVYMALKTGVIDGITSGAPAIIQNKHYEVVKYGYNMPTFMAVTNDIVVNRKAWDALPDDLKRLVTAAFDAYSKRVKAVNLSAFWDDHYMRLGKKYGMEFTDMTEKDVARHNEACIKVHMNFIASAKPRTKEAWEIIKPYTLLAKK